MTAGIGEGLHARHEKLIAHFYKGGVAVGIASENVTSDYFKTFPPILDKSIDYTESRELNYDTGILRYFSGYYLNLPNRSRK